MYVFKFGLKLSLMKQMQRKLGENSLGNQPSGCWEDNGRAAVRTPQVSSGNGLLTKPCYPARFLPTQSVPSHMILIIIPSKALGKSLLPTAVILDSQNQVWREGYPHCFKSLVCLWVEQYPHKIVYWTPKHQYFGIGLHFDVKPNWGH